MHRRLALAAILFLIDGIVSAAEVPDQYQQELSVSATDDTSRVEDFRRALSQVLGRLIAREAMGTKTVSALLARSSDYVEQFEYLAAPMNPGEASSRSALRVRFDRYRLNQLLRGAGIGIWGGERPELVVWLVVHDGSEGRFTGGDESAEFNQPLQSAGGMRGLPIVMPLLDLTDQTNLTLADVEAGNEGRIREATRRYESDVALAGTLRRAGDNTWEASWLFVGFGQNAKWRAGPLELREVIQAGVDGAYGRLISLYAPAGKVETVVEVEIRGIASMSDAERCGDYLRTLPTVKQVDWLRAELSLAVWRVRLAGSVDTFRQILGVSRVLRSAAVAKGGNGVIVYQWVP